MPLTDQDELDVRDTFEALDNDHDGLLNVNQVVLLYRSLAFRPERISDKDLKISLGLLDDSVFLSPDQVLTSLQSVRFASNM